MQLSFVIGGIGMICIAERLEGSADLGPCPFGHAEIAAPLSENR
jgi:hypothetical protein